MSRRTGTIPAGYFDDLYAADGDPWRFRTSTYEADKYRATLAMLGRESYDRALEVGCSIGVFTRMLASRCRQLDAIDGSETALALARADGVGLPQVQFARRMVPDEFPPGSFDLIVLSEVLYYLTAADVARTAVLCRAAQPRGGEIVACHWLGETDYPLTGNAAVEAFRDGLDGDVTHKAVRHEQYRLDRFRLGAA